MLLPAVDYWYLEVIREKLIWLIQEYMMPMNIMIGEKRELTNHFVHHAVPLLKKRLKYVPDAESARKVQLRRFHLIPGPVVRTES